MLNFMMVHTKIQTKLCINKKAKNEKGKDERCKKDAKLKYEIALKSLQKEMKDFITLIFTTATLFYRSSFLMFVKRCIMSNTNLRGF